MTDQCEALQSAMNAALLEAMKTKVNSLDKCDATGAECPCTGTGGNKGDVDLVLLIDSSGSMSDEAASIETAAEAALNNAVANCGANVRVTWLYNHGGGPMSTKFAQSHNTYLKTVAGVTEALYSDTTSHQEAGGVGIADIARFFDWTEGACRSMVYFTDTGIYGGNENAAQKDEAVLQATENDVTVFVHNSGESLSAGAGKDLIYAQYTEIAETSGGFAILDQEQSATLFEGMLEQAVCSCGGGCEELEMLGATPCVSVRWGDSPCDAFETDDLEKLYITVSNCYGNISFSNLTIGSVSITDAADAPVAALPDGTPSVDILPTGPIAFGEIPSCVDGVPGAVTREFSIHTRGAVEGDYKINLSNMCYGINTNYSMDTCFGVKLCRS